MRAALSLPAAASAMALSGVSAAAYSGEPLFGSRLLEHRARFDDSLERLFSCFRDNWELAQTGAGLDHFESDQDWELSFHLKNEWRRTKDFEQSTWHLFRSWGLGEDDFRDQVVVDLGAGSRLRTAYFKGSRLVAIEPLAARLLPHAAELPHIDLGDRERVWQLYSMPAEFRACEAEGQASLVVSVNVLDHVWQPERMLHNAERLLRPCSEGPALLVVSVDLRDSPEVGHPNIVTRRWFREQFHPNRSSLQLVKSFHQDLVINHRVWRSFGCAGENCELSPAWTFFYKRKCPEDTPGALQKLNAELRGAF